MKLERPYRLATASLVAVIAAAAFVAHQRGTPSMAADPTPTAFGSNKMYLETPIVRGWYDVSPGAPAGGRPFDPAEFRLVPGDRVELRAGVTVRATGKPVRGRLTVSTAGITGDEALRRATRVELTSRLPSPSTVTDADDGRVVDVRVRLTFDGSTPQRLAQNERIDLDAVQITVSGDESDPGPGTVVPGVPGGPGGSGGGGSGDGSGEGGARPVGPGGGGPGGVLPGRDPSTRVPLSSVPSGPTATAPVRLTGVVGVTGVTAARDGAQGIR